MEIDISMIYFQTGNFQITDKIIVGNDKNYNDIFKLVPTNKTWDIKNGFTSKISKLTIYSLM